MVNKYPPVTVVMTTFFPNGKEGRQRYSAASSTLLSWSRNLYYSGAKHLHIADDGSTEIHAPSLGLLWVGKGSKSYSYQNRRGVGASLNAGFSAAFDISPIVLYAVDDWSLTIPFNIDPWVQLLMEREDVGMVRLGPPHPNTTGKVEVFTSNWQGWGLRLDRQGFAFGHRPALYHKRMIDSYGWFEENVNALECERLYAVNYAATMGPDIVLALPHPWQHIDSVELAYLEP